MARYPILGEGGRQVPWVARFVHTQSAAVDAQQIWCARPQLEGEWCFYRSVPVSDVFGLGARQPDLQPAGRYRARGLNYRFQFAPIKRET